MEDVSHSDPAQRPAAAETANSGPEVLKCSCCGDLIRNTAEENARYGERPYPYDEGFGMCLNCGGEPNCRNIRKRLGWAGRTFYEARFEILRQRLSKKSRAKFEGLSYAHKCAIVAKLIEKGAMI